ncbi:MAG: hypothetical protein ACXWC4_05475 [Telluria sp.]
MKKNNKIQLFFHVFLCSQLFCIVLFLFPYCICKLTQISIDQRQLILLYAYLQAGVPEKSRLTVTMTTEEILVQRYGVLLTLQDCAKLLCRSAEGLRVTLSSDNELARKLRPAKVKIGRRVLFKASVLGQILDDAAGVQ